MVKTLNVNGEQKGASFKAKKWAGVHGDLNPKHIKTLDRVTENPLPGLFFMSKKA